MRVGVIGLDDWLHLPPRRFAAADGDGDPAEHFYQCAFRFEALFGNLILPLQRQRSLQLVADVVAEQALSYRRHVYQFDNLDIILLEGIFLLKRTFQQDLYDVSIWVDCSFATALKRAVERGQEGLSPEETVRVYKTLYFPAQQLHLTRDKPRHAATMIVSNDPRLDG